MDLLPHSFTAHLTFIIFTQCHWPIQLDRCVSRGHKLRTDRCTEFHEIASHQRIPTTVFVPHAGMMQPTEEGLMTEAGNGGR